MKRDKTEARDARGATCILSVRLECSSEPALDAAVEALQGSLGAAEKVSRIYPNRTDSGKRVYLQFIVPAAQEV